MQRTLTTWLEQISGGPPLLTGAFGRLRAHLTFGAALLLLGMAGCVAAPPLVPPTELTAIEPGVTFARRWKADVGEAGRGRFEPVSSDERIIMADARGVVTALDRRTGMRQWSTDLDTRLASGVGGNASQVFVGGADGVVHALSSDAGEELWQASMSSEVLVAPVAAFGAVVVRSVDGRIAALEPEDGSERWSVSETPPALTVTGYGQPLLVDGGALVGIDDGRLLALSLDNGRKIWETVLSVPSGRSEVERLVDLDADPRADDAGIYVVNYQGRAARLEPARGQVIWSLPLSSTRGLELSDGQVVVVDDEDGIHALDAESGRKLWSSEALRGRRLGPPAVLDDGSGIVVGDFEGFVHMVSMTDGSLTGRTRASKEPIDARPIIADDVVYVLASDGIVNAYEIAR